MISMVINSELKIIFNEISELYEDSSVPKNVRTKLDKISTILNDDSELPIKINRALDELDELAEDTNLEPYTRTQIWNLVSVLESI